MLERQSPDVCVLLEIKASPERCEATLANMRPQLAALGYKNCYWSWCTHTSFGVGYSGTLAVSKTRPDPVSFGLGHSSLDKEARVITLRYADKTIVGVYSPNTGINPEECQSKVDRRILFEEAMFRHLTKEKAAQPMLCYGGDLNVAPAEIDIVTEREGVTGGCTPTEREFFCRLQNELGLVDSYRLFHDDAAILGSTDVLLQRRERRSRCASTSSCARPNSYRIRHRGSGSSRATSYAMSKPAIISR